MVARGELTIIPVGFRCHTKIELSKQLGLKGKSLPFDNGFFPPQSVASIMRNPQINLHSNHRVCIKYESYSDPAHGNGIKFEGSTYDEIDEFATDPNNSDINMYLDATYGYYTRDLTHNFVLAHYNWHKFADAKYHRHIDERSNVINDINDVLNRRVTRMFEACNASRHIIFVYAECQQYNYMAVDNIHLDLKNLAVIRTEVDRIFPSKSLVVNMADVDSPKKILRLLNIKGICK